MLKSFSKFPVKSTPLCLSKTWICVPQGRTHSYLLPDRVLAPNLQKKPNPHSIDSLETVKKNQTNILEGAREKLAGGKLDLNSRTVILNPKQVSGPHSGLFTKKFPDLKETGYI